MAEFNSLKREKQQMPEYIREALEVNDLLEDYNSRPPYQRNDYLSWISRAKRPETRRKRLHQMLAELHEGGIYMNMDHPPSRKEP